MAARPVFVTESVNGQPVCGPNISKAYDSSGHALARPALNNNINFRPGIRTVTPGGSSFGTLDRPTSS